MEERKLMRCPFESQGIEDGTIPEIALADAMYERLQQIQGALMRLRVDTAGTTALRFVLPDVLMHECGNTRVLKHRILPYQMEIAAANIDIRLRPLLWYHRSSYGERMVQVAEQQDNALHLEATWFKRAFKELGYPPPPSLAHLAVLLETILESQMTRQLMANPQLSFIGEYRGHHVNLITIDPSGVQFHLDRQSSRDPRTNHNFFSVVKCSLYPASFWRYSDRLEIVMTREADFVGLSNDVRKRIRAQSNEVYREGGVTIEDDATFKPPSGLWQIE